MGQSFLRNDPVQAREYFQNKISFTTGPAEVSAALKGSEQVRLIDVRRPEDFAKEHIPGAVNLPEDQWHMLNRLSLDHLNIIYCYSHVCHLAARAAVEFASAGFSVMEMDGGFKAWKEYRYPTDGQEATASDEPAARAKVDDFTAARMTSHH
jgi:rhodanese-related sulfurtransferase